MLEFSRRGNEKGLAASGVLILYYYKIYGFTSPISLPIVCVEFGTKMVMISRKKQKVKSISVNPQKKA